MSFSPATVANFFLDRARSQGRVLTPMQVIKLVYIAHGWHWGYFDSPLISEPVEAWKFGPVIPSLYRDLKTYGNSPVQTSLRAPLHEEEELMHSGGSAALLDHVWERYNRFNGVQLSTLTHQPGTPWDRTWEGGGKWSRCSEIPEELIAEHYRQMIRADH